MNEKRTPLTVEEPKHKKKSKKKGLPRADHKHEYKTVLLHRNLSFITKPGKTEYVSSATKVCTICGKIGYRDDEQYEKVKLEDHTVEVYEKRIKDPETLEKWYCDDYFDKFAHKKD